MELPNRKIKGKYYFVDDDNNIIREATEEEIKALEKSLVIETPSRKEQIINAVRERYSVDDELAILRQRDTKPDEFAEYFAFVEGIKRGLKDEEAETLRETTIE